MKGLIEDTVVISYSEDGIVHCIFDFVHGYLSNCKVQLFGGQNSASTPLVLGSLSNDDGNSNKNGKKNQ